MNSIQIDGRNLQYESEDFSDMAGDWKATAFYEGTELVQRKRRIGLFKSEVYEVEEPKFLFRIYENVNNILLSKSWWKRKILHELELVDRENEIKRGELI